MFSSSYSYLNNSDSFLGSFQRNEFSFASPSSSPGENHVNSINNSILHSNPPSLLSQTQKNNVWSNGQWVPNYSILAPESQSDLKSMIVSKPFQKIELTKFGQNNSIIHLKALRSGKQIPFLAAAHRIGIDWIPPMNANIHVGPQIKFRNEKTIMKTTNLEFPNLFRWDNLSDVQLKRYPNCKNEDFQVESYCEEPQNQLTCGSCWSFGGAGFLTDRFRIWSQTNVPILSPTVILACATKPNGNQCNGGNAQAVFDVCTKNGTLAEEDAPYDSWCSNNNNCNSSDVPSCNSFSNNPNRYFGDSSTTLSSNAPDALACTYNTNYDNIINEIWQNGPVMSGYYVFADFYGPIDNTKNQDPILWESTSGIYMNGANIYSYKYNNKPSWNQKMGAHMIVIVGWGEKEIDGIVPQNSLFTGSTEGFVPFWIIRNSWGSSWNANNINNSDSSLPWLQEGGYFYVAMSGQYTINGTLTDVNKNIGLDHLVSTSAGRFGGCWFFGPKVTFVDMDSKCSGNSPDPDPNPDPDPDPDPNPDPKNRKKQIEKRLQNVIQKHKDLLKPKPFFKKKTWFEKWNEFMLELSNTNSENSSCGLGACLWNNDQCLNTTETVCSLLSQGKGSFLSNRKCIDYINKKGPTPNQNEELEVAYPCLLPDGSCLMVTEEIAKNVLPEGKLYYNLKSCAEAKYGSQNNDNNDHQNKKSNLTQLLKEIMTSANDSVDNHIETSLIKQIIEDKKEKESEGEHLFFENDHHLLEYLIKQLMICKKNPTPSPSPMPSPMPSPSPVPLPSPTPNLNPIANVNLTPVSKNVDAIEKAEKKKEKETIWFQALLIVLLVSIFLAIIIGTIIFFAAR